MVNKNNLLKVLKNKLEAKENQVRFEYESLLKISNAINNKLIEDLSKQVKDKLKNSLPNNANLKSLNVSCYLRNDNSLEFIVGFGLKKDAIVVSKSPSWEKRNNDILELKSEYRKIEEKILLHGVSDELVKIIEEF